MKSLQARLTVSYVVILLVCLVLVGLAALVLLRGYQRDLTFRRLQDRTALAARLVGLEIARRGMSPAEAVNWLANELSRDGGPAVSVYLLDPTGRTVAGSDQRLAGQRLDDLSISDAAARAWPIQGILPVTGGRLLYVADLVPRPVANASRAASFVLVLASPNRAPRAAAGDLFPRLAWAGVAGLVLSVVVAGLMAYSIARPLERIARAAEEIAAGNYDQQLDISTPTEVGRLAASFNRMAHRVKATLQSQRDLVANVSHELKTPLTSIQGFSQALIDGTAADEEARERAALVIHEEAGRMHRLVRDLLDLARLEAGQVSLAHDPVDVVALLQQAADHLAQASGRAGVAVAIEAPAPLPPVIGDGDRLGQVFGNLLENAIKHSAGAPGGGRVVLGAEQHNGVVRCTVTDNGPGIPAADLPRVFERFYQVDKSRARPSSGAGLGLAIAQEIVQAHGGQIGVESVERLGSRFTVDLPARPAQPPGR